MGQNCFVVATAQPTHTWIIIDPHLQLPTLTPRSVTKPMKTRHPIPILPEQHTGAQDFVDLRIVLVRHHRPVGDGTKAIPPPYRGESAKGVSNCGEEQRETHNHNIEPNSNRTIQNKNSVQLAGIAQDSLFNFDPFKWGSDNAVANEFYYSWANWN